MIYNRRKGQRCNFCWVGIIGPRTGCNSLRHRPTLCAVRCFSFRSCRIRLQKPRAAKAMFTVNSHKIVGWFDTERLPNRARLTNMRQQADPLYFVASRWLRAIPAVNKVLKTINPLTLPIHSPHKWNLRKVSVIYEPPTKEGEKT